MSMTKITKMTTRFLLAVFSLAATLATGQGATGFRQYINYRIEVRLDDEQHQLHGQANWEYFNKSATVLTELYVHLWPNAYSSRSTAFARQQLRYGNSRFYFADDADLGGIDSLSFSVNGQAAAMTFLNGQPDMAILQLPSPLKPGERVSVSTPFRVKIPASFSRLGHIGQSYQVTQWYPKPAVYDATGWHPMPYLDAGEFYSDFGAFDVYITLPDNYQVAATGVLQNQDERRRLREVDLATRQYLDTLRQPQSGLVTEAFPPSAPGWKILHYHADNVHDFAWFADKRFKLLQDTLLLPSGREITAAVYFTQTEEALWKDALEYVKRSARFYSAKVGDYPYPQVTAVQSALSAGGGMEYPMITVIDLAGDARSLDQVITHEVGHNWFYGILASNERDHAWMDEGLNSYYEQRYMRTYYPQQPFDALPALLTQGKPIDQELALWEIVHCNHYDQIANTTSDELTPSNYLLGAYIKPALALAQWEGLHGANHVDKAMQAYYRNWQFRHPQPADLQRSLEQASGEDLGWLFEGFLGSLGRQDYALLHADATADSLTIHLCNRGEVAAPLALALMNGDSVVKTYWMGGFTGERQLRLPAEPAADRLAIDPNRQTLDARRRNNYYRLAGPLRRVEPLRLRMTPGYDLGNQTPVYVLPLPGWNQYDKLMAGLLLHGGMVPARPLEWFALPMYSFGAQSLTGMAGARYRLHPLKGAVARWELSANIASFHTAATQSEPLRALRAVGALRANFTRPSASTFGHYAQAKVWNIRRERPQFLINGELVGAEFGKPSTIAELAYGLYNRRTIAPWRLRIAAEYQTFEDVFTRSQDYVKLSLEAGGSFLYQRGRRFFWRAYGGYFPSNSLRGSGFVDPTALSLMDAGYADYRLDQYFMGRAQADGLGAGQLGAGQGGFHTAIGPGFMLGRSHHYLFALNLSTDLPVIPRWLPLRPWFDAGYYDEDMNLGSGPTLLWSAGLGLEFMSGRLGIYWPLAGSPDLMDRLAEKGGFPAQLSFRVLLHQLTPWGYLEDFLNRF